ncbi:hypothetical protein SAMN05518849_101359 [Sphingobium sp. AP50]|uniref:DUF6924 domain-containing protein n=1 Tax=Sphingobium sp. AP50 TaxID=1884369 RepID=UPI0008AF9680|nr:hypothetical protein [Sphingobium sp. AP50]SEI63388.1 hypothetical protein SAMN05518849_101359 [Sphingobium sp. AP50]
MIPIDGDRTPLVRTDFSNDRAWERVIEAVSKPSVDGFLANLNPVNDHRYDNADPFKLAEEADANTNVALIVIADSRTMIEPQMPLLCVDPIPPGGQFRCIPAELWGVENNVSLANMDFSEFASAVEADGVFRGFQD